MGEVGDIISHAEFGMGKNNVISSLMMEQEKSNFEGVDEAGKCHDIGILLQLKQIATVTASTNQPNYCLQR